MVLEQPVVRVLEEGGALRRRARDDRDGLGPVALVPPEEHGGLARVVVLVHGEQEAAAVRARVVAHDVAVVVPSLEQHVRRVAGEREVTRDEPELAPPRGLVVQVQLLHDLGLDGVRRVKRRAVERERFG